MVNRAPSPRPGPRRLRIEQGPFLTIYLLLVVVAIMWMPFGCRDSTGVSELLPALRPMQQGAPHGAVATATSGERRTTPTAAVLAVFPVTAFLAASASVWLAATGDATALRRSSPSGPLRPRAPPLAA